MRSHKRELPRGVEGTAQDATEPPDVQQSQTPNAESCGREIKAFIGRAPCQEDGRLPLTPQTPGQTLIRAFKGKD